MSGFLKGIALFNIGYEIDFVKLALILAICDIVIQLAIRRIVFSNYFSKLSFVVMLFFSWMIITLMYSPSIEYKYDKILNFLPNLIFLVYPIFIKKINFNLLIKWYAIILLPLSLILIYFKSITWSGNIESPELWVGNLFDYLSLGLHLGILFFLLNYFNKDKMIQIVTLLLLSASSARAPLIILLFLLLILNYKFIFKFKFISYFFNVRVLALFSFLLLFLSTEIIPFFNTAYLRLIDLFGASDHSLNTRLEMYDYSFNQPFESFVTLIFGNGIGSFGLLYNNIDARAYPHNILLEIFFELGLIGLFFGLLIFLVTVKKFNFKKNVFSILILFVFLNAMKSSNLTDSWILFSFIGASSITYSTHKWRTYNINK